MTKHAKRLPWLSVLLLLILLSSSSPVPECGARGKDGMDEEKLKSFETQEVERGFSLFEAAQDGNVEE